MTPSKALFFCCISFVAGIALEYVVKIPHIVLWGFLLVALAGISASFFVKNERRAFAAIAGFCLLFLVLGISRLQMAEFAIVNDPLGTLRDNQEKITFIGQITGEPNIRETTQKLTMNINGSKVLITLGRYPQYRYLDTLQVTGTLKTPTVTEDFDYQKYLQKDGIYSVMDFPRTELLSNKHKHTPRTLVYEALFAFKAKLEKSINSLFTPPEGLIVKGIILGGSTTFPAELKQKFSSTGLTHITAISGSNVVTLSNIVMAFLLFLGFWRGQAFYGAAGFVWLYAIIAGMPASGVRAAIMATVFLLAQKMGRQNASGRVMVLAAAVMLMQNPLLLMQDVGFQLSFLASMGIIYINPLFSRVFSFIENEGAKFLLGIFSVTMAAQICTLPVVAYYFKTISLVAPITNMLVIPTIEFLMVFGFLAAFAVMFTPSIGFILSIPAWIVLVDFMKILDWFGQPWAAMPIGNMPVFWLALYYLVLACLVRYAARWLKPKFLGY